MRQTDFERRVLEIWMRSRVPLTLAHVQHLTGAPRDKARKWLDSMVVGGGLDADVDDEGEMVWKVRGAERAPNGPVTVAEMERLQRLTAEVSGAAGTLARVRQVGGLARQGGDQKSLAASGVLSLFFGPLGWLYAAPLREAVPAVIVLAAAGALLPAFILTPLLGIVAPLSGVAGIYYAWRHNQTGERTGLFSDSKHD